MQMHISVYKFTLECGTELFLCSDYEHYRFPRSLRIKFKLWFCRASKFMKLHVNVSYEKDDLSSLKNKLINLLLCKVNCLLI